MPPVLRDFLELFYKFLLLDLKHDSFAHILNIFSNLETDVVLSVELFTVSTQLVQEDLRLFLVDLI